MKTTIIVDLNENKESSDNDAASNDGAVYGVKFLTLMTAAEVIRLGKKWSSKSSKLL